MHSSGQQIVWYQRGGGVRMHSACVVVVAAAVVVAAGCADGSSSSGTELVLEGLKNPTGLAVLDDGTLLVVESGAGRIFALDPAGATSTLVGDFTLGTFVPYDIGPLSLVVRQDGTLIVGEGGEPIGHERISLFDSTGAPLDDATLVPLSGGNFYGLAIHPTSGDLYAASANTNRILRAPPTEGGGYGEMVAFVENTTDAPVGYAAPTALAFESSGVLLVGFGGFDGAAILRLSTDGDELGLVIDEPYTTDKMITAIAVRPSDGAVFFAEAAFESNRLAAGRVARIVVDEEGNEAIETFVDKLTAPSALAFGGDDSLHIATLGAQPNDGSGTVHKTAAEESDGSVEPAGTDASDQSTDQTDGSMDQPDESTTDETSTTNGAATG